MIYIKRKRKKASESKLSNSEILDGFNEIKNW